MVSTFQNSKRADDFLFPTSFFSRRFFFLPSENNKPNMLTVEYLSAGGVKTHLAFPNLLQVIFLVVLFVVGVPIVYLLSKALKIRPKPITIAEPSKEATLAIIVTVALFVLAFVLWTLNKMFQLQSPIFTPTDITYVLWIAFWEGIGFLIVIVAMKSTRQEFRTLGIDKNNIGRMVAFGLIPSVIYLTFSGLLASYVGGGFTGFSSSLAYGLLLTTIVGFSEEAVWRGYIQTRLSAYGGTIKGLMVASLLFALWHFPVSYYYEASGDALAALAWASVRVFGSLLFGYIMLKCQNIIPSSIFHLFIDWGNYLWRIS